MDKSVILALLASMIKDEEAQAASELTTYPQVAPERKVRRRSFVLGFNSETESWARGSLEDKNTNEKIISPAGWSDFRLSTQAPIESGEDRIIRTLPQVLFKPVVVWFEKPLYWEVQDLRIGQSSQFVNMNSVLAAAFMDPRFVLNFDTAQIAQDVSFRVKNIGPEASHFRAAMLGDSIE